MLMVIRLVVTTLKDHLLPLPCQPPHPSTPQVVLPLAAL
jgi:hypothetical protein